MLVYLNQARATLKVHDGDEALQGAIVAAASQRLRPILMTTATVVLGLSPIMLGDEAGSQIMQRIAAPMIGGHALSAGIGLNRCAHGISATLSPPAARPTER